LNGLWLDWLFAFLACCRGSVSAPLDSPDVSLHPASSVPAYDNVVLGDFVPLWLGGRHLPQITADGGLNLDTFPHVDMFVANIIVVSTNIFLI
jgi:hypothetical protein